jgi:hypothetical protein
MANIANVSIKSGNILSLSGSSVQITGSVSASGDVYVDGRLTAREYYTQIVSSSVIYQSGSTKFGDDASDTHQFTGSVNITGALNVIGTVSASSFTGNGSGLTGLSLGGSAVTSLTAGTNLSASASTGAVTVALTGSITSGLTTLTGVTNIGATTGSFTIVSGNGASITNITASNIPNFSADVRSQLSATGSVSYNPSTGVISSSALTAAVTEISQGSNIVVTNGTGPIVTVALTSSVSGLTDLSSSAITGSDVLVNSSLKALGSFVVAQVTTTTNYSVTDLDQVVFADAATGPFAVTIPVVSAGNAGRQLVVKKIDATINTVTVSGSVDGASTYELNGPYQSITLVCDGTTNWFVL